MCFSAEASFGASAALFPMGAYCVRQAIRYRPRFLPFACVPLAFAVQQLSEAVIWQRLLQQPPGPVTVPAATFLFFAIAWWPAWFPVCAAFAAPTPRQRVPFVALAILSLLWFVLAYLPAFDDPDRYLTATIVRHSICYPYSDEILLDHGQRFLLTAGYLFFTCSPLLLLSVRVFLAPVLLAIGSAIISTLMMLYAFTSVWCFFAAVLSAFCTFFFYGLKPPRPPAIASRP
jgi:hypothetical protein